ncbi:MAG: zinc transport system ATP-binding protein [Desulfobacteraceae bacterium Eth-SRB2]|nr:MAG: zinc transport system ATP-binding protein [Desulfobacteraceae bacterium Eth-SRB2]
MKKLIEIKALSFGYRDNRVLEDIDLDISEQDYLLVIGPNGGGKTTLLKLILGIIEPWSGSITFNKDISNRLGYVPQSSNFNKNFPITVFNMVLTGCINSGNFLKRYRKEDIEKTEKILEQVNLYDKRNENINNLSGGQLQRSLIARSLVSDPAVLLLDEPTASIDISSKVNLKDFLNQLNEKMTIVVVTHDLTAFARTYTHIACINKNLYPHGKGELNTQVLEKVYGCPVELLGHGIPHTILKNHG